MLLVTDKYIFNLEEILYVAEYDSEHIKIVYKNNDEKVFHISYDDFSTALNQCRIR